MGNAAMRLPALAASAILLLCASGAGAGTDADAPAGLERHGAGASALEYVPGEVVVRFRAGTTAGARTNSVAGVQGELGQGLGLQGAFLVELADGVSVEKAVAELESDPGVLFAEPNYLYRLSTVPNDPDFDLTWGLSQATDKDIDAPAAWTRTRGSSSVLVGVIDSGIAYSHPDLAGNMWLNDDPVDGVDNDGNGKIDDRHGWDFVSEDATPLDYNGHGTHVAGTIGAVGNNSRGVPGVNWDVSLMALRAADPNGSLTNVDITEAINYACANGADVVNGSFGGGAASTLVRDAILQAPCANTLFVFAAGNDGLDLDGNGVGADAFPCEFHRPPAEGGASAPNIICVGATGKTDVKAGFSNHGTSAVHIAAPGVGIRSTWPGYSSVMAENFEGTAAQFNVRWGNRMPAGNPWGRTSATRTSGSFSITDSPVGVSVDIDTAITKIAAFSLAGRTGCRINYNMRLNTDNNQGSSPTTDDILWILIDGLTYSGWSGSTGGAWFAFSDDFSDHDGDPSVQVGLGMDMDGDNAIFDGGWIDDLAVACLVHSGNAYNTIDGTSMATPHVAGVAALLLADNPALTVAQLKNAILTGVDTPAGLNAFIQNGRRLNAAKALGIVPDDSKPNTTITAGPRNPTTSRTATFKFKSSQAGSKFECKHMNGPWTACKSPKTYRNLGFGSHTCRVRAIDPSGNVDATPAVRTWRVRRP